MLLLFFNKSLKKHPNPMFAYFMLFDSAFLFNYRIALKLCDDKQVSELLKGTLFFLNQSKYNEDWANYLLVKSNIIIQFYICCIVSAFSIGISKDLVKTIRYPIDKFDKRLQLTFISSAILLVLLNSLILFLVTVIPGLGGRKLDARDITIMIVKPIVSFLYIVEVIYSFQALYVAGYGICIRKGLNFQMRKAVFRKYVLFVAVRLITIVPTTISNIALIYNRIYEIQTYQKESDQDIMNYPQTVEILISFRGFFYFLIFVLDFELRTAAAKTLRQFFGMKQKKRLKSLHENDYTDAFLYSSLNMELVCSILNGIQQNIMVDMFNNHQSTFDECNVLRVKDFSATSTANLTKI